MFIYVNLFINLKMGDRKKKTVAWKNKSRLIITLIIVIFLATLLAMGYTSTGNTFFGKVILSKSGAGLTSTDSSLPGKTVGLSFNQFCKSGVDNNNDSITDNYVPIQYDINKDGKNERVLIKCDLARRSIIDVYTINMPVSRVSPKIILVQDTNLDLLANEILMKNSELLGVDVGNLQLQSQGTSHADGKKKSTGRIIYTQTYNGLPVFGGVVAVLFADNKYAQILNGYYPITKISNAGLRELGEGMINKAAQKYLNNNGYTLNSSVVPASREQIIFPLKSKVGVEYKKAWKLNFDILEGSDLEFPYSQPTLIVDAVTSVVMKEMENLHYTDVSGMVTGLVEPPILITPEEFDADAFLDPEILPLKDLNIHIDSKTTITDANGQYVARDVNLPVLVEAFLMGPYVEVFNCGGITSGERCQGVTSSFTNTITSGTNLNIPFQSYDSSQEDENTNVFYHLNKAHDFFMRGREEPFNVEDEYPVAAYVNVNDDRECSALAFTGSTAEGFSVTFLNCPGPLSLGTIYHEYTHVINKLIYRNIPGIMDEALAYYYGSSAICGSEEADRCAYYVRHPKLRYPDNYNSPTGSSRRDRAGAHANAWIITSALNDLRVASEQSNIGESEFDELIFRTTKRNAAGQEESSFFNFVEDLLLEDDYLYGDADITNGGPHLELFCEIMYDKHGLYPEDRSICPSPDRDGDTVDNFEDNCPSTANTGQEDHDRDLLGDVCDNCPFVYNDNQQDSDNDETGDACDDDIDGDGRLNELDNCPDTFSPVTWDTDEDRLGNACDQDDDNDGILDESDNCPYDRNPAQEDEDNNGRGDFCSTRYTCRVPEERSDGRPRTGVSSTCRNTECEITIGDSDFTKFILPCQEGYLCQEDGSFAYCVQSDFDRDGIYDNQDNCPQLINPRQEDIDEDHRGDLCDFDRDGDNCDDSGTINPYYACIDNCPNVYNPEQEDSDHDGIGDACDT